MSRGRPTSGVAVSHRTAHLASTALAGDNDAVTPPRITITCDCGAQRRLGYGERYTCECGRSWSTSQIPAADYDAIRAVDRRFRRVGWLVFGAVAVGLLFFLLTRPILVMVVAPTVLFVWFMYARPIVRRRHRRAIADLTRTWELRPEPAP